MAQPIQHRSGLMAIVFAVVCLASCGVPQVQPGQGGTLSGKLDVRWIGENQFIYMPNPTDPLTFVTTTGKRVQPGLMFTDGGSVPPVFWGIRGFSPWGYAPGYIVHDWLFVQRRCHIGDWETVSFDDSARILGEVIDTLMRDGQVPPNVEARSLIELAVRSAFSRDLWNSGECSQPTNINALARNKGVTVMRLDFGPAKDP